MATGFFSCGYNFFFRRVSFTKADIIAYGVLKQIDILKYHRDVAHQTFWIYLIHRNTIEKDTSFLWVVETGAKLHHRTFPASRRSDKSRQGVFRERNVYIMQHFLVLIGKRYVFKPDIACCRGLPFSFHLRLVHQGKDASTGNGKIAELGKVCQCGSQRVEHTRTDHKEQHKYKD